MDVLQNPFAIGVYRHWGEDSGADHVSDLQARMVVAVGKSRKLQNAVKGVTSAFELLCKDGMSNWSVEVLEASVQNYDAEIVLFSELSLKGGVDRLNGERIN